MAPKRPVEAIDLTSDDSPFDSLPQSDTGASGLPYHALKHPRTAYTQSTVSGASRANPVMLVDDEEEEDASQEIQGSTQGYNEQQYSYILYGSLDAKIVGVRYYNGYATTGERVICRREPHNQYDCTFTLAYVAMKLSELQGFDYG